MKPLQRTRLHDEQLKIFDSLLKKYRQATLTNSEKVLDTLEQHRTVSTVAKAITRHQQPVPENQCSLNLAQKPFYLLVLAERLIKLAVNENCLFFSSSTEHDLQKVQAYDVALLDEHNICRIFPIIFHDLRQTNAPNKKLLHQLYLLNKLSESTLFCELVPNKKALCEFLTHLLAIRSQKIMALLIGCLYNLIDDANFIQFFNQQPNLVAAIVGLLEPPYTEPVVYDESTKLLLLSLGKLEQGLKTYRVLPHSQKKLNSIIDYWSKSPDLASSTERLNALVSCRPKRGIGDDNAPHQNNSAEKHFKPC